MADPIKVKLLDAQKNPILPETSADQVTMADGGNVETKIKALEGAVSGKVPCHIVEDIPARDGLESPKQGDLCWVKDASADESVHPVPWVLTVCTRRERNGRISSVSAL